MEKNNIGFRLVRSAVFLFGALLMLTGQSAYAAISYSQSVTLEPGWNIVSTPRILDSHAFSTSTAPSDYSIYVLDPSRPSGWATMSELGQTKFTPLYGYFVNNKTASSQPLTFNYKASTTPNERLFTRTFTKEGWYSFGIANPSYAKKIGESVSDTDNPSRIVSAMRNKIDLTVNLSGTTFPFNPDTVAIENTWEARTSADIDLLTDFRETKGYAVYVSTANALYSGFQDDLTPVSGGGGGGGSSSVVTTADFTSTTFPIPGSVDAQNNLTVWQKVINVGSRNGILSAIRVKQMGSIYAGDVVNYRLYIDDILFGQTSALDPLGYASFDLTSTPILLPAGSHAIKIVADVVSGSSRNFQFSLRATGDVVLYDAVSMGIVTPTVSSTPFTEISSGVVSINAGTLTITKNTSSPSGTVILSGSNITLGKFTFRAQGETLKVENLRIGFSSSDAAVTQLRNGALFLDGVQIGSTATISTTSTQFNLGSSMVLSTGRDYTLEVRADIHDSDGTNDLSNGDTLRLDVPGGLSNVYRMSSLSYISNTSISGNPLTVSAGTLSLVKFTAYANQTITVPQTAYKLGEWRVTSGSIEGVNIDTISVLVNNGSIPLPTVTNLYVVYGTKTTVTKATIATTSTFSVNEALAANTTMNFAVYGTIDATPVSANYITMALAVSGTSQNSGIAVTSTTIAGQTITISEGILSVSLDALTPVAAIVVGNSMPKVASFKFTAQNDAFTITGLTATSTGSAAITELVFKDGATEIGRQSFDGSVATRTGISVAVPYNSNKVIDVYANLGSVGTGAAATGANVGVALIAYERQNSNGVRTSFFSATSTFGGVTIAGNNFYAVKTKPTVTNVALPTTVLNAGTQTIGKVTVTADAGGTLSWRKLVWNFSTSTTAILLTVPALYDAVNESSVLTGVTVVIDNNTGKITASSTAGAANQEVSGSKTYVLKATVGGVVTTGGSVSTSIAAPSVVAVPTTAGAVAATGASFVWSDQAILGHAETTADWYNDFLVKNFPTDSQTATK